MAKKSNGNGYKELTNRISAAKTGTLYILHGEERFLLEHGIAALRKAVCPDGLGGFNYRRYEGAGMTPEELGEAVDTLPVFAERTLIEVFDYDIFKMGEDQKTKIAALLEDLPDYVCLVLVFDTVAFKPDKRLKLNARILKSAEVIEFAVQESKSLVTWIQRHFKACSKRISPADAEYLAFVTGSLMTALNSEIEKVAAYSQNEEVTRLDIDTVVEPVLDAAAYKLTDAVMGGDGKIAMKLLDELFRMREAPHKLIYGITMKMRQMLAARVCFESNGSAEELMELCSIRYSFQARALMDAARRTDLETCRRAVLACCETAFALNSAPEPESRLVLLITRLAAIRKGAA